MLRSWSASMTTCIDWICRTSSTESTKVKLRTNETNETDQIGVNDFSIAVSLFVRVSTNVVQSHLFENRRLARFSSSVQNRDRKVCEQGGDEAAGG